MDSVEGRSKAFWLHAGNCARGSTDAVTRNVSPICLGSWCGRSPWRWP